jgi:NADH-quinone oxidoreductase subunit H
VRIPFTQVKLIWLGLFHGLADGIKMMLKEDFRPISYDSFAYALAPWVVFTPVLLVFAVIPFGGSDRAGRVAANPAVGVRVVRRPELSHADRPRGRGSPRRLRVRGTVDHRRDARRLVVGQQVLAAGRAARRLADDFLRAHHGLTVLGLILIYGTVDLDAIVRQQSGVLLGFLPAWGVFLQPFAAILFLVAAIAENKRIPFDLPEAESELIAGYFTEYSAMKMGLFMFAEFIEIAIIGALFTTLFLGGYNLPFMTDDGFLFPGNHAGDDSARGDHRAAARRVPGQGADHVELPDPHPLDAAALRWDQLLSFAWKFMFRWRSPT